MQNPINKEIRHYQEEIFMGLTLRQLICSVIAIGAAVLAYLTLEPVLGRETTSWVCIVAAVPIAAAGFFRYDDLNFERWKAWFWAAVGVYGRPNTTLIARR